MRQMLLFSLFVLVPSLLYGQVAPYRASESASLISSNIVMLSGTGSIDDRKRELLHVVVRGLNQQDGGNWGELLKTDQGGYIPADIIVWRPTMEHFDVLTDSGPMWEPKGVVSNPAWLWVAAPGGAVSTPTPQPPPVITQVQPVDYGRIREMVADEVQQSKRELYDQAERIYADMVNRQNEQKTLLEQAQRPGVLSQTFGNRYVQIIGSVAAALIAQWQMTN